MSSEYIQLLEPTAIYLKKNILQSQLECLRILQKIDSYKKLRTEELNLKIAIKIKLDEIKSDMLSYSRIMPKVTEHKEEPEISPEEKIKMTSLEVEIEIIKKKLSMLSER